MQNIPEVTNKQNIITAEFVKLSLQESIPPFPPTIYTFSSAYDTITIDGVAYTPLGDFLSVGAQTRNLRVTETDTTIALAGVSGLNIYTILSSEGRIRGSEIEVKRGFFNDDLTLINSYTRFTGIITNYSISEDLSDKDDNFTVVVSASSYKTILENRVAGRKTNKESWRYFNNADASMDNVYSISGVQFDFGQDPKNKVIVPGYDSLPPDYYPGTGLP